MTNTQPMLVSLGLNYLCKKKYIIFIDMIYLALIQEMYLKFHMIIDLEFNSKTRRGETTEHRSNIGGVYLGVNSQQQLSAANN